VRLAALVGVFLLLLSAACSDTRSKTLQLAPSATPPSPAFFSSSSEVFLPQREPRLSIVLENARWEGATLVTLWKITNVGTERLGAAQWQIGVSAIDPLGKYVDNLSNPSRSPLPLTATLHPGEHIAGERLLIFGAPAANAVIGVKVSFGFGARETYSARFKAPRPPPS